ncbi:hypothetical protein BJY52DRAFT_1224094 [Lactarius psammicola]|nr:hypothetical protein BJY52DRAFT_1224094 [Lactarius psammicola]
MALFAKLLSPVTVLLTLLSILTVSATPWPATYKYTTHHRHYLGAYRSLKLKASLPNSNFVVIFRLFVPRQFCLLTYELGFSVGGVDPLPTYQQHPRSTLGISGAAVSFLASRLSVSDESFNLRASAQGQAAHHVFLVQKISATLELIVQQNGFAVLARVIQIKNENAGTWYEAFVDAHNNTMISVTDFVYRIIPIPANDPDISIDGFVDITDPENLAASPNCWNQEFNTTTNATGGNNAIAYKVPENNTAVKSSPVHNFAYFVDPSLDPSFEENVPAAITNAFHARCHH